MIEVLPILGEPTAAVEPTNCAFDNPASGENDKALDAIGALDDFGLQMGQDRGQRGVEDRPVIGAVGKEFPEKWEHPKQGRQHQDPAGAILNIRRGDQGVQQQTLHIDENVPLFALDQLARVQARRVEARPPFSALFTLWLSMMQAVGLASRSACSRHLT